MPPKNKGKGKGEFAHDFLVGDRVEMWVEDGVRVYGVVTHRAPPFYMVQWDGGSEVRQHESLLWHVPGVAAAPPKGKGKGADPSRSLPQVNANLRDEALRLVMVHWGSTPAERMQQEIDRLIQEKKVV